MSTGSASENILKRAKLRRRLSKPNRFGAKILAKEPLTFGGALAEDALRASDILKPTPYTLVDAARFVAQAHSKLEPHSVRMDDAINEHAAAIERRKRSLSVNQLRSRVVRSRM
jgi:hypothetical protein